MPAAPDVPAFELTEDKVLRIKYADRWTIAWKCVLDDNNNVTDLLPARNGLPEAPSLPLERAHQFSTGKDAHGCFAKTATARFEFGPGG